MSGQLACVGIGYALGNILTADVVCRRRHGVSAFDVGVGNPGMANVGHEFGTTDALLVLAGDIAKTLVACVESRLLFPALGDRAALWAAVGATLGHDYPIWHRFRGGKGVTTTCAGISLTSPVAGTISALAGAGVVAASGYLCLGALTIPAAFLCFQAATGEPERALGAAALLALALPAHLPAALQIKTGETPRTDLASTLRGVIDHLRGHRS